MSHAQSRPEPFDPVRVAASHAERAEALGKRESALSLARVTTFLLACVFGIASMRGEGSVEAAVAGLSVLAFGVLLVQHDRVVRARADAEARRDVHLRHAARAALDFAALGPARPSPYPPMHPYAGDVDLGGPGSLLARIDVTHTVRGAAALARMLGAPADVDEVRHRQDAVRELVAATELRESLEAAATVVSVEPLDDAPFLAFTRRAPVLGTGARVAIGIAPLLVLGLIVAAVAGLVPTLVAVVALTLQGLVAIGATRITHDVFQLVAARHGYVEAFRHMLTLVERSSPRAPLLEELRASVFLGGRPPSESLARLDRWASLAEFHTQFPVHFVVNLVTLYDLHVLAGLERWNREAGRGLESALEALGTLEALSSLACLATVDPGATFPEIDPDAPGFDAEGLAHPLLSADARVPNDLRLGGPGHAIVVTGSNMAGKSTLLRSVGLQIALAQAGGPVIAKRLRMRPVRLRASMRVDDSLQKGASYFRAELDRLRVVVEGAEDGSPVFFLLDELLRGTNADARHRGARAVLGHLLDRGAIGLVATHDVDLARLETDRPGAVENRHFTDVMADGEMVFDYRLRPGVVRTSNALRLLGRLGIEVPEARERE